MGGELEVSGEGVSVFCMYFGCERDVKCDKRVN